MLRINLLPAYVAQRRLNTRLAVTFGVLFVAIVGSLGSWYAILEPQIAVWKDKADQADQNKTEIEGLNAQAAAATATIAPIQTKLQFVKDVQAYNLAYIQLYQTVAKYTSPRILYKSMAVSGTTMTISAYTPSFADLGRYLQVMYTEPDVNTVSISGIPGYGSPNPDVVDTQTVPTGAIGHLPGYPGPVTSFSVYRGQIVGVNGRMIVTPTTGGKFDMRRDGFPVTVTMALKKALAPPPPPGAGPAAPGAPGMSGPGGPGGPGGA